MRVDESGYERKSCSVDDVVRFLQCVRRKQAHPAGIKTDASRIGGRAGSVDDRGIPDNAVQLDLQLSAGVFGHSTEIPVI
ncbi:hypothetical protein SDC9_118340 [bioreactor metagenome]|uniref:Uncharacterized protein n=1 Tax=bioreactor metagenome TaxID=1076179 RepID=A0A645C1G4_9ZZZZ